MMASSKVPVLVPAFGWNPGSANTCGYEGSLDEMSPKRKGENRFEKRVFITSSVISGLILWVLFIIRGSVDHYFSDDILNAAPLIDGHNDFPIWIRAFYHNHIYQRNFTQDELYGQVDFPRMRKGHVRGQFWSAYVECPKIPGNHSDETYYEIIHDTLQQIDLIYRLVKAFPEFLEHSYTAADVRRTFQSTSKIASLIGIEGLHQIGNSASILRMYHSLGVRYATLTHTCHNSYADSEEPHENLHGGLSQAGEGIVKEMNRIGMIIDVSHTSFETQRAVLKISRAPVIFSHSNAYTLCNHTRNVPDDILRTLRENEGVVMVTFYPAFLHHHPENASLQNVADHIEYIGNAIGYRHVGLGSDFDGMQSGPLGLEDVTKYPDLIKELEKRGVRKTELAGIMGLNVLRVLEKVEHVAMRMRDVLPLEDDVKLFFGT